MLTVPDRGVSLLFTGSAGESDMRLLQTLAIPLLSGGLWFASMTICTLAAGQEAKKDAKPTLEGAFRKWHMGLSSENKEERLDALRSMFPTKKEVAYLFPQQVDKLWPQFEDYHKLMEKNVDLIAKEMTRGGAITKFKPIDTRVDKSRASGSYKELLAIIPKDIQVFEVEVSRGKGVSGGGTYLFIKDRWFWIRDLEILARDLDKPK
jgi:hypothetical protein